LTPIYSNLLQGNGVIYNTCVKDAPTIEKGIMDLKGKAVRAKEATKIV
jgi:hypothetical protein